MGDGANLPRLYHHYADSETAVTSYASGHFIIVVLAYGVIQSRTFFYVAESCLAVLVSFDFVVVQVDACLCNFAFNSVSYYFKNKKSKTWIYFKSSLFATNF